MCGPINRSAIWTTVLSTVFVVTSVCHAEVVIDLEGFDLGADGFFRGPADNAVEVQGQHGPEQVGTIEIDGVGFINRVDPTWDSWSGFSISSQTDTTTPGAANQFAAFAGGGSDGVGNTVAGGTYAMANGDGAYFNLPELTRIESTRVTNSTYAALSMRDGDDFAKAFSTDDNDFFSVTFEGWSGADRGGAKTGEVEFFLADFRGDEGKIVDTWEYLELSSLGDARSVGLQFASSDVGQWGVNTPKYAAIDSLRITAVPEPGSLFALGLVAGVSVLVSRVRRRRVRRPNAATANVVSPRD